MSFPLVLPNCSLLKPSCASETTTLRGSPTSPHKEATARGHSKRPQGEATGRDHRERPQGVTTGRDHRERPQGKATVRGHRERPQGETLRLHTGRKRGGTWPAHCCFYAPSWPQLPSAYNCMRPPSPTGTERHNKMVVDDLEHLLWGRHVRQQ